MTELPPPSAPVQQPISKIQKIAIIGFAFSVALFVFALLVPGDNSSAPATTVSTTVPVEDNNLSRYDMYLDHVHSYSNQSYTWSDSKVIEFGDLVCKALDEGNSVARVVSLLESYAENDSDVMFFASVTYGAITYVCPEYDPQLQAYLNT